MYTNGYFNFLPNAKQSLFSSVIRKVYLAIVGAPFISLIYGVASRMVDIFASTASRSSVHCDVSFLYDSNPLLCLTTGPDSSQKGKCPLLTIVCGFVMHQVIFFGHSNCCTCGASNKNIYQASSYFNRVGVN